MLAGTRWQGRTWPDSKIAVWERNGAEAVQETGPALAPNSHLGFAGGCGVSPRLWLASPVGTMQRCAKFDGSPHRIVGKLGAGRHDGTDITMVSCEGALWARARRGE